MARGNQKGQASLKVSTNEDLVVSRANNTTHPGIPIGRGPKSLLPIKEAYKKYPEMEKAIGKYEPFVNRYRNFQLEGVPYDLEKAFDKTKADLDSQLANLDRKVTFKLGPFQQRESSGVLESTVRFKTISAEFELVTRRSWTGPLEAGDPKTAFNGEPEHFIRRVKWTPYKN